MVETNCLEFLGFKQTAASTSGKGCTNCFSNIVCKYKKKNNNEIYVQNIGSVKAS